MQAASGTIKHTNWDENPYHDSSPHKGTIAHIDAVLEGDLKGDAKTAYVMAYNQGGTSAHYTGHLLFTGTLGDKRGSFVLFEQGYWGNDIASSTWQIATGSGTGDFTGISGAGRYATEQDKSVHYTLEYDFNQRS